LGVDGVANLARGLRTNMTLKQLHLTFCQLPPEAGEPLGEILANAKSALEVMALGGNRLGGRGLYSICQGLAVNTKLTELKMSDNMIDHLEVDVAALEVRGDCGPLVVPPALRTARLLSVASPSCFFLPPASLVTPRHSLTLTLTSLHFVASSLPPPPLHVHPHLHQHT
jgi:hypothetical protein